MRATPKLHMHRQPVRHTVRTIAAVPLQSSLHATTHAQHPPPQRTAAPCLFSPTPCTTAPTPVDLLHCCADTSSAGALAVQATHQHQPCTQPQQTTGAAPLGLNSACNDLCAQPTAKPVPDRSLQHPAHCYSTCTLHPPTALTPNQIQTNRQLTDMHSTQPVIQGHLVVLKNTILGSGEQSSSVERCLLRRM